MIIPPLELMIDPGELFAPPKPKPAPARRRTSRMIFSRRSGARNATGDVPPPPAKRKRFADARQKRVKKARRSAARSKAAREEGQR